MIGALCARLLLAGQLALDTGSLTHSNDPSQAMLQNGQYFEYVRTIEQELTNSPSDACLHASLALGYCLLGQHRFCDEEIRKALALLDGMPRTESSTAPANRGCPSQASSARAAAVSAQVHYVAGRLDMENAKFKDALTHFEAALLVDPDNSKIEYFLSVCLQALNRREDARTHLATCL